MLSRFKALYDLLTVPGLSVVASVLILLPKKKSYEKVSRVFQISAHTAMEYNYP